MWSWIVFVDLVNGMKFDEGLFACVKDNNVMKVQTDIGTELNKSCSTHKNIPLSNVIIYLVLAVDISVVISVRIIFYFLVI